MTYTPDPSVTERVARSICDAHGLRKWDDLTWSGQEHYKHMARAAITSMPNPALEEENAASPVTASDESADEVERIADGLVAIAAEAHTRHFNPGLFEMDPPRFEDADDCFVALLEEAKRLRAAIASLSPKNGSEGVESFNDLPWRDGKYAPKDGTLIAGLWTMRWTRYKAGSEQVRRHGKNAGRWQAVGRYGGWENCDAPEQWLPHPKSLKEGASREG